MSDQLNQHVGTKADESMMSSSLTPTTPVPPPVEQQPSGEEQQQRLPGEATNDPASSVAAAAGAEQEIGRAPNWKDWKKFNYAGSTSGTSNSDGYDDSSGMETSSEGPNPNQQQHFRAGGGGQGQQPSTFSSSIQSFVPGRPNIGQPVVLSGTGTNFFTAGLPPTLAMATEAALRYGAEGRGCPVTYGSILHPHYASNTLGIGTSSNQFGGAIYTTTQTTTSSQSQMLVSGGGGFPPPPPSVLAKPTLPGPPAGLEEDGTEHSLRVEDALNYLDKVKSMFGNKPVVYNEFLDIMKNFKSQSLDTPGVIARVAHLFSGYPELIMGFNVFLPTPFKIDHNTVMNSTQPRPAAPAVTLESQQKNSAASLTGTLRKQPEVVPSPSMSVPFGGGVLLSHHMTTPKTFPSFGTALPLPNISPAPVRLPALLSIGNNSVQPIRGGGGSSSASSSSSSSGFMHYPRSPFVTRTNAILPPPPPPGSQTEPVEFNMALEYVNKIKHRFLAEPDKYKQFLDILHTYRKEQRVTTKIKDGETPPKKPLLTEDEVYNKVVKLFESHDDLLQEFAIFLPEVVQQPSPGLMYHFNNTFTQGHHATATPPPPPPVKPTTMKRQLEETKVVKKPIQLPKFNIIGRCAPTPAKASSSKTSSLSSEKSPKRSSPVLRGRKRLPPTNPLKPLLAKKIKITSTPSSLPLPLKKASSVAELGKLGTLNDFEFFDRVRAHLQSDQIYDNFIRTLKLYNEGSLSRCQTVRMVTPFLSRAPELLDRFMDFMKHKDQSGSQQYEPINLPARSTSTSKREHLSAGQILEIDYATCKRLGESYCTIPRNCETPKASGRTPLCDSVLNDKFVNFPTTWYSDGNVMKTARRNQFEEHIAHCENERFELDLVLETHRCTMRCLEVVQDKMARMSPDELTEFELDDCLGGTSTIINQRSIKRIYGEDVGVKIIEGLKTAPTAAVPIVLKRLKQKEAEWMEAQKGFNQIWRERQERYYLKSLDHQGIHFRQGDIKALRSKALITEIEVMRDEDRHRGGGGAHLTLLYRDRSVLDDALNLILYHVRRQDGISFEEKREMKKILKQFIPELFSQPKMEMSDDEDDEGTPTRRGKKTNKSIQKKSKKNGKDSDQGSTSAVTTSKNVHQQESRRSITTHEDSNVRLESSKRKKRSPAEQSMSSEELQLRVMDTEQLEQYKLKHPDPKESYKLFYVNNTWYVFLRLHQILCERLTHFWEATVALIETQTKEGPDPINSTAFGLGMMANPEVAVEDYYTTFLDMIKDLLDGSEDPNSYEDRLREMFGIRAYIGFTMDQVVANAVRRLHKLVADEACRKCLKVYLDASGKGGTGGSIATASDRVRDECLYRYQAEKSFGEENFMKVIIFQTNFAMTMELLDGEWTQSRSQPDAARRHKKRNKKTRPRSVVIPSTPFLIRNKKKFLVAKAKKQAGPPRLTEVEERQPGPGQPVVIRYVEKLKPNRILDDDDDEPETNTLQYSCLQYKINPSTSKMMYVPGGEDYFYQRGALLKSKQSHKTVSLRMCAKFMIWHGDWLLKNTTRRDKTDCEAWLKEAPKVVGGAKGKKKYVKVVVSIFEDVVPYHRYRKYIIA